ncbi:MAG TPA: AAA family ATPase [Thermoleophilia bacterium]|nr:AAA family ATPase [Thermoleophilia bacterium]
MTAQGAAGVSAASADTTPPVVVLLVGIPGAGKTTLIDRAGVNSPDWIVLDPDRIRRRLSPALRRLPIPYPLYVVGIVVAISRHTRVLVESRGTYAWLRRLVTACARVRRRRAVLVLLDASSEAAVAGQVRRGRVVPARIMRLFISDWSALLDGARSGALAAEGWSDVRILTRAQASDVRDFGDLVRRPSAVGGAGAERGGSGDRTLEDAPGPPRD